MIDEKGFERELGVGTVYREREGFRVEAKLDNYHHKDPDAQKFLDELKSDGHSARKRLRVHDRVQLEQLSSLAMTKADQTPKVEEPPKKLAAAPQQPALPPKEEG